MSADEQLIRLLQNLRYGRKEHVAPGTLSWLDPNNNKAFLAGEISLTYNPISIYYVAKTSPEPPLRALASDIYHAHLPIGPVNRATEMAAFINCWVLEHTK